MQRSTLVNLGLRTRVHKANFGLAAGVAITGIAAYSFYSYSASDTKTQTSSPPKVFGSGPVFKSLQLDSVETLNHDTKRFRFALPTENSLSGLTYTSTVLTFSRPKERFFPVIRPYTPVSDLNEPGYLDLVIKEYPQGKASRHIHSLKPGDSLTFLTAIKSYDWKANERSHVTLLAGGAGITPLYQLLHGILTNPLDRTKITLVFGINTDADALFREQFSKYEKQFPDRFKVLYTVTNPSAGSQFHKGRITKELLKKVMAEDGERDTKFFVCGPPPMEEALMGAKGKGGGILGELGVEKERIHKF
ncbi:hypothetical protein CJF32_00007753 [Rutstroemia sp. NJR-2017a WRK4]|nr:hypothetical protein CJF32_00007753 [Rutstroemia sp. NJR-2017a WRK4]